MNPALNLDNAIAAHSRWKMKFRTAIAKRERVDCAAIHRDGCELGNWLSGPGRDLYGSRPQFLQLAQRHDAFHLEADKVLAALNAGRFGQARAMIAPGSPFSRASSAVNISWSFLKQSVGG
jgi:methyl-accepting chemotaxis protein